MGEDRYCSLKFSAPPITLCHIYPFPTISLQLFCFRLSVFQLSSHLSCVIPLFLALDYIILGYDNIFVLSSDFSRHLGSSQWSSIVLRHRILSAAIFLSSPTYFHVSDRSTSSCCPRSSPLSWVRDTLQSHPHVESCYFPGVARPNSRDLLKFLIRTTHSN